MWLKETVPHLQAFALQYEARHLIGEGIAAHYNRIADQTVRLPHSSKDVWIPAYKTTEGVDPMAIMGVTARRVARSYSPHHDIYKDTADGGRAYFRIMAIAANIGWVVPGIKTEETRASILDAFSATMNPQRVVDPKVLFMAGSAIAGAEIIPLTKVFGPQK